MFLIKSAIGVPSDLSLKTPDKTSTESGSTRFVTAEFALPSGEGAPGRLLSKAF